MKTVFGLVGECLLCELDAKEGCFLVEESDMGHGEIRFEWGQRFAIGRFVTSQKRNLHLIIHYPHELC